MRLDKFLFADMVRQEVSGQWTIVGMIPGDALEVHGAGDEPFVMPMLSCLAVFADMQGVREVTFQFEVSVAGQVVLRSPPRAEPRATPEAKFHTQALVLAPFQGPGLGSYTFTLIVSANGETKKFSRQLILSPASPQIPQHGR